MTEGKMVLDRVKGHQDELAAFEMALSCVSMRLFAGSALAFWLSDDSGWLAFKR